MRVDVAALRGAMIMLSITQLELRHAPSSVTMRLVKTRKPKLWSRVTKNDESAMSNWVTHYSADGRPYWFNSLSKESVWEKPRELQSALEIELANLSWKEYETKGRKYWVHNTTKETTWEMPTEVRGEMSLIRSFGSQLYLLTDFSCLIVIRRCPRKVYPVVRA